MVVYSKPFGDGHFDASLYVVLPAAATLALGTLAYVNRGCANCPLRHVIAPDSISETCRSWHSPSWLQHPTPHTTPTYLTRCTLTFAISAAPAPLVLRRWIADSLFTLAVRSRGGEVPGKEFLEGNYAPVREEVESEALEVEFGFIPKALEGMYLR